MLAKPFILYIHHNITMIDPKIRESDKMVLKRLLGNETYEKLDKLQNIVLTYVEP